jgi:hypothetical protein
VAQDNECRIHSGDFKVKESYPGKNGNKTTCIYRSGRGFEKRNIKQQMVVLFQFKDFRRLGSELAMVGNKVLEILVVEREEVVQNAQYFPAEKN